MHTKYFVFFAIVASDIIIANARLLSSPSNQEVVIGEEVLFKCSTSEPYTVNWLHKAIGSERYRDVFIDSILVYPYKSRFKIVVNSTLGRYDLIIASVSWSDAGTFKCIDDAGQGEEGEGELTILGGRPICRPLSSLSDVVGENDCGIEPDELQFECHLRFSGNLLPKFDWKHKHNVTPRNRTVERGTDIITETVTLIPTADVDGRSYICETSLARYNWTSAKLQILYAFNTMTKKVSGVEETCVANSNQQCVYFWTRDKALGSPVVSVESRLTADSPGVYRCWANCTLRGVSCVVQSNEVHFMHKEDGETTKVLHIAAAVLTTVILISILILFISFKYCKSLRKRFAPKDPEMTSNGRISPQDIQFEYQKPLVSCEVRSPTEHKAKI